MTTISTPRGRLAAILFVVLAVVLAAVLAVAAPGPAVAQSRAGGAALQSPSTFSLEPTPPVPPGLIPNVVGPTILAPGGGLPSSPPATTQPLMLPSSAPPSQPVPQTAPAPQAGPSLRPGEGVLNLSARFGRDAPVITGGLQWRVYSEKPDQTGGFRLIKEDRGAQPSFVLPAGGYVVHVALGLASAVKVVRVRPEGTRETFEIPAGGLSLKGQVGDAKIPAGQISFDIYKGSQFDQGDQQRPIAGGVMTGDTVLVPEGTYYILSKYGDGNAVVRSDIRVQAGKLTDVTVTHRAAAIMLKLVSKKGGEALANTDWAVLSPAGDTITESKGAFPRVILAEGEYKVIARSDNKVYQQDLKVIPGVDGEIEVLAR